MDDLLKRFVAIAAVVTVILIFMPRRKPVEAPQPVNTEAVSAPVKAASVSSAPADEIDSETVRSLVEADEHFATPLTSRCPKRTSSSYPDGAVATLARSNSVSVAKDGTVSITSDGFLNNPSTKDDGDHWTFTTANRKFLDVVEKRCYSNSCMTEFSWTWEPTVIGQDLQAVHDTGTNKTNATFTFTEGQWKLSTIGMR